MTEQLEYMEVYTIVSMFPNVKCKPIQGVYIGFKKHGQVNRHMLLTDSSTIYAFDNFSLNNFELSLLSFTKRPLRPKERDLGRLIIESKLPRKV